MRRLIFPAFFLSGFAGLMHQVVWAKLLVQLIGATAHAQTIVLAVFMGGLALGAVWFGRKADRSGRPLQTYVALEVAIAVYCLLLPLLLQVVAFGYLKLAGPIFESIALTRLLRFGLAFSLILLPAVWMGGTLPLVARFLIERVEQTQRQVASLYTLNSWGAVLGAATAGFLILPLAGIYISLALASALNLAAGGLVAFGIRSGKLHAEARRTEKAKRKQTSVEASPIYSPAQYVVTLVALALTGFAAMGYEVIFIRVISLSFGSSTYSFTVMLMCFITGISIGSALVSRIAVQRPLWWLGMSQLAVVVALIGATPLVSRLPYLIGLLRVALVDQAYGFELYQLGKAALCLAVLLVPTICLGVSFPLVARIQARTTAEVGSRVGTTYAWNTAGNVLGVAITSLVLFPALGLLGAFHFNLSLNAIAGVGLLLVAVEMRVPWRVGAGVLSALALLPYLSLGTGWSDPLRHGVSHLRMREGPTDDLSLTDLANHPTTSFDAWKQHYLVRKEYSTYFHFEEDSHVTVLAVGDDEDLTLHVNTKPDASVEGDLPTQLLLAHAPLFMAPEAKSLLVIGHGSGITAGSALRHPIEWADIVEISDAVIKVNSAFESYNYFVLKDPRVRVYVDDAQSFLRAVPRKYDVIISEPSNPWIAGIGGLFTVEFFELARDKLSDDGVYACWMHSYEQTEENVELVLRSLGSVFPHVMVFRDYGLADLVAVASMRPIQPDFPAMEKRFDMPAVRSDLARLGIRSLAAWLPYQAVSPRRFRSTMRPGPLNTALHERLEYSAPRSFFYDENSQYVSQVDPLMQGAEDGDGLIDRYAQYREAAGDPLTREELEQAAATAAPWGENGPTIARALNQRASRTAPRSTPVDRPARGGTVELAAMGAYELILQGDLHKAQDGPAAAVVFYARAAQLRPFDIALALDTAQLMQDARMGDQAARLLEPYFERHPDDIRLLRGLGWAYLHAGERDSSRAFHLAVVDREERSDSLGVLAAMMLEEDDPNSAIQYFERALKADPAYWQASVTLAKVLSGRDRTQALRVVENAIDLNPEVPQLREVKATLASR